MPAGAHDSVLTPQVNVLLDSVGVRQAFLSHSETQGEVLEGFVLMALDAPVTRLVCRKLELLCPLGWCVHQGWQDP